MHYGNPAYWAGFLEAIEILLVDGQVHHALKAVRTVRGRAEEAARNG